MAQGRKTGGRQKGTPNKATADVKAHAQQYTIEVIDILIEIARNAGAVEIARIAAAREILDRAIGKATQAHQVSGTLSLVDLLAPESPEPADPAADVTEPPA